MDFDNEKLSYQLLDLQGRPIDSGQILSNQTQIDMHDLQTAIYYLNVVDSENKKVQSFKIIKN